MYNIQYRSKYISWIIISFLTLSLFNCFGGKKDIKPKTNKKIKIKYEKLIPVYEFFDKKTKRYFYVNDKDYEVGKNKGIKFYSYSEDVDAPKGARPIYLLSKKKKKDIFYNFSLEKIKKWKNEKVQFRVHTDYIEDANPVYQFYSKKNKTYYYSVGDQTPPNGKWKDLGIQFYVTKESNYKNYEEKLELKSEIDQLISDKGLLQDRIKELEEILENERTKFNRLLTDQGSKYEGAVISFASGVTDDGEGDTHVYNWDFGDGETSSQQNPDHIYKDNGIYKVCATVLDDDAGEDTSCDSLVILNVIPELDANIPTNGYEGSNTIFQTNVIDPGESDTHSYIWDFGDGNTSNEQNPQHNYIDDGTYTVCVEVADDDGDTDKTCSFIIILNENPVIEALNTQDGTEGQELSFSANATDPAGENDQLTYTWDFGDGQSISGIDLIEVTHTYTDNTSDDNYTIILTVSDENGGTTIKPQEIILSNSDPEAKSLLIPDSAEEGTVVSFSVEAVDMGSGDSHKYLWDFGDGMTSNIQYPDHIYKDDGEFSVCVIITDDDGGSTGEDENCKNIKVTNVAPKISVKKAKSKRLIN